MLLKEVDRAAERLGSFELRKRQPRAHRFRRTVDVLGDESGVAGPMPAQDFDDAGLIAAAAWEQVVRYVEEAWQTYLLHP